MRVQLLLQGKGEFTMEYASHEFVAGDVRAQLMKRYQQEMAAKNK
jgi:hypothetical protein